MCLEGSLGQASPESPLLTPLSQSSAQSWSVFHHVAAPSRSPAYLPLHLARCCLSALLLVTNSGKSKILLPCKQMLADQFCGYWQNTADPGSEAGFYNSWPCRQHGLYIYTHSPGSPRPMGVIKEHRWILCTQ